MYELNFSSVQSSNEVKLKPEEVRKVILVIDLKNFGIGDSVVAFGKLRALQSFLYNARIEVYTNKFHYAILKNNPCVEDIHLDDDDLSYDVYDLILLFSDKEEDYKEYFQQKAGDNMSRVLSLYGYSEVFPTYIDFLAYSESDDFQENHKQFKQEMYISEEEKAESDKWFREAGVADHEKVVVFLDTSSGKEKILPTTVLIEMVKYFKAFPNTKVLIFDERNSGKEEFYKEYLQADFTDDIMFCTNPSLRKNINLLSSDFVKVIFGPCTGLLHCAAGAYEIFKYTGRGFEDIPVMIAYFGTAVAGFETNEWDWWGHSLVDAIYNTMGMSGQKEIKKLEGYHYDCLRCSEFETDMLTNYLEKHYGERFKALNL
ncbi:glycosyltransferase family 9 protein [Roseivirga sp. BDSF3-8]|uniref:glycosyltransferase family 9 protein n=1 Tax=Roseivirga sp. BDSF3-8 TaxID=3241598 RepID=UPI0035319B9D